MDPGLYKAATSGDVEFLEQVSIAVNTQILLSRAPQENTALHISSRFGHANFARKILQISSQLLRMENSDQDTALHCAARAGCLEIVQILMDFESSATRTADHDDLEEEGRSSSSSVRLLRMQSKEGNTALHEALKNRRQNIAIKIVRADPKLPFVVNNAKESSFLVAAKEEMVGFVKEILVGIDPSENNEWELSAALNITSDDCVIPITTEPQLTAEELRELIKIQDGNGRTALHYAVWRNNAKIVSMILKTDSRHVPYVLDNNGYSPLHVVVAFGKASSISKLLKYCPDAIEQVDWSGRNVLHIALLHRRFRIIRKLLELPHIGGLPDGPDKEGNMPIHLASKPGTRNRLLIKKSAKLDMIRNEDNQKTRIKCGATSFRARPQRVPDVAPMEEIDLREWEIPEQVLVVVASLIATVSFAAAFTLPGGYRSSSEPNPGIAILASKPAFKAFVLLDTLAMSLSVCAIFFYTIAWWPGLVKEKPSSAVSILTWGNRFTLTACTCMVIALSAGVFVVVSDESMGLAIAVIVICCPLPLYWLSSFFFCCRDWLSSLIVLFYCDLFRRASKTCCDNCPHEMTA